MEEKYDTEQQHHQTELNHHNTTEDQQQQALLHHHGLSNLIKREIENYEESEGINQHYDNDISDPNDEVEGDGVYDEEDEDIEDVHTRNTIANRNTDGIVNESLHNTHNKENFAEDLSMQQDQQQQKSQLETVETQKLRKSTSPYGSK